MAALLLPGDPAPWVRAPTLGGKAPLELDIVAGRFIVLLLLGSAGWEQSGPALAAVARHQALLDDASACLFGVTIDRDDAAQARIARRNPGIRWFLDYDRAFSRAFGAATEQDGRAQYRPHWLLLDRTLRVVACEPIDRGDAIFAALREAIATEPPPMPAPVLVVPRVLGPELCRALIAAYEADGGHESGFMREEGGMTVLRTDPAFKRRQDYLIETDPLRALLLQRIRRFLAPPIQRAFQFDATEVERLLVACYDDRQGGGFFGPHRDNTTKGTAHRRFAVTINLNAGDYEGGDLRFPEYGARTYRAPTGGAVVFSCALLHEVLPVRRGRRYAFLPFLYDEAGAALRTRNLPFLDPAIAPPAA